MTGDRLFTFTTETDQLNRPPPQLIGYQPWMDLLDCMGRRERLIRKRQ